MILSDYHRPVLLPKVIELLKIEKDRQYLDATLGGGGYAFAIIGMGGKVLGIDLDPQAVEQVKKIAADKRIGDDKLVIHRGSFAGLKETALDNGFEKVRGIIFDLGVSSHQLDRSGRGFTFRKPDEALDMRFAGTDELTAAGVVNQYSKEQLYEIFAKYAEELSSRTIADAIVRARTLRGHINKVGELNSIIKKQLTGEERHKDQVLARIYQSLRIEVNSELSTINRGLTQAIEMLQPGGRVIALSYHSLEDRLVKQIFRENKVQRKLKIVTKNPIRADFPEIKLNPRARSAKLRAAEKI